MITIRRSDDRFHTDAGWLDSRHTFSFGGHYDPRFQGFRDLLVINDDRVAVGGGFPMHGHRDMEIISYVVEGALGHKDSMGNAGTIEPGDVQRMSAGTGVMHSEMNAAKGMDTHFFQIWIVPKGPTAPSYEQKHVDDDMKRDTLKLVAAGHSKADADAVTIHADADVFASKLSANKRVERAIEKGRHAWVHVVDGRVSVNGEELRAGDGAALSNEAALSIEAKDESEVLVFDLA